MSNIYKRKSPKWYEFQVKQFGLLSKPVLGPSVQDKGNLTVYFLSSLLCFEDKHTIEEKQKIPAREIT